MRKKRKHILSDKQIIGAVVLLLLVAAVEVFIHLVPQRPASQYDADSLLQLSDSLSAKATRYTYDTVRVCLRPFDPNTADSTLLLQLGLKRWQVRNLLKYREKGGVYRRNTDLKKLYGMTDSVYLALEPFIRIDTTRFARLDTTKRDSVLFQYRSLKRDTVIELNSADTLTLQCIPGIGIGIAKQIIRYRTQLGGYYSPEQIREIDALQHYDQDTLLRFCFDSVMPHLYACADSIKRISVNHSSIRVLQRHPYMRFEQAKALYTLRRNRFHLDAISDLQPLSEFTEQDLQRLQWYLSFDR
ncbi:MAG: helix-hairpin-helix domain-containing protein [Bacteroidales bacterium]|nr:helix-hairpin-helix domain-containing protein [Bacteroidales bacterium]